jgi:hypothetical protein
LHIKLPPSATTCGHNCFAFPSLMVWRNCIW